MKFEGRNVFISDKAKIGKNVKIGDNSSIYDNAHIGDNSIVADGCAIGEPINDYYTNEEYVNATTFIGEGALIRSKSIIYCGCKIGKNLSTGHRVTIREESVIGDNCRIGTLCDLQGKLEIGNYTWLHSNVHIGQESKIGNYVFIYPYVVFTNDPTPPSDLCMGPTVDDYTQIAVYSVLLPDIKIGKHCLIGAGSLVGKDIGDYKLAIGSPAKIVKDVREIKSREDENSHYPWPYNFERGMPWEGIGYDKWKNHD
ncbi:N-acetyltransferase [Rhodohalobacter sp. SW132]|uniref:acyltransferase n=1 Tax=Rhodohalobacter sp. SW132 TaxID=2293433 RepID=UPI000E25B8E6|nr:acyltransferase [Rhodohalobacter sp. SW132]REL38639.1 N-acetyltransferase [Rhodohalobacter sp. SW132]